MYANVDGGRGKREGKRKEGGGERGVGEKKEGRDGERKEGSLGFGMENRGKVCARGEVEANRESSPLSTGYAF